MQRNKRRSVSRQSHPPPQMPVQPPAWPAVPPYPVPPPDQPRRRSRRKSSRFSLTTVLVLGAGGTLLFTGLCILFLLIGFGLLYSSNRILPGVSSAGVSLGNTSQSKAAVKLSEAWAEQGILLRDGDRVWAVPSQEIGITLDAAATAAAAQDWGRKEGGLSGALRSIAVGVKIDPVLYIDFPVLSAYLQNAKSFVDIPAVNAGVQLVNGQAEATAPINGRELDAAATIQALNLDAASELADGAIDLIMRPVSPTVTDASPLVAQANALLTSPFSVNAYDPVRDEWLYWTAPPEVWATWLTASSAPNSPMGLALSMNTEGPLAFVESQSGFGDERFIKTDDSVSAMQSAISQGRTSVTIRVWHNPTTYTVQVGQTLASIAEDVGIPYPYIQAENPAINPDALSAGQVLTLPSRDVLLPLDPISHKRIIVSRSQQHLWAYENGQVIFDWVISTGLPSSPTALGVFQVQSHELNAYADQWNLYMPHFMGFYHPGPNMDLMNGFHGFPTRGGGYLLWSDDLGTPVTYGCVLLSLENAEALYNWAEEGVVVEVRA